MIIDLPRFLAASRPAWTELEVMLDRMDDDAGYRLSFEEMRRFYRLYQRASADLAKLQTFASRPEVYGYLQSLTARAYSTIHESRAARFSWRGVWSWFWVDFPVAFRRHVRAFLLSSIIMFVGAAFGAGAVAFDPEAKRLILPEQFSYLQSDPAKRVQREESATGKGHHGIEGTFSASLMQNNIRVSFLLLALGMTWGLGTMLALFGNGVILGGIALDYIRAGQTTFLLGWLLPHGVIEIPAIVIAGQGGLLIGKALLGGRERSTLRARFQALGPDLLVLIGGVAVMLVWAGLIEAFFSQLHAPVIPYLAKIAFGVAEAAVLTWFLWFHRRRQEVPA